MTIVSQRKLADVLLDKLWAEGVRQLFGIPGDYALNLFNAVQKDGRFQLVTLSHEPAVRFAAGVADAKPRKTDTAPRSQAQNLGKNPSRSAVPRSQAPPGTAVP